jgi:uncharacterized protein (DUF885 family)
MPAESPVVVFRDVAEAAIDELLRMRPDVATWRGDHRYDDQLPDLSEAGVATYARRLRHHIDALDSVDVAALPAAEQVDAAILRNGLERELFAADVSRDHEWNLLEHDPGNAIYLLLARDTTPLAHRVMSVAARLAALPDFLSTTRRTVSRAPKIHAETALAQLPGVRALVTVEVDRLVEGDASLLRSVAVPRDAVLAALDEHERWLRGLVATADRDPRLGAELFERKLPLTLDSPLSADEMLQRAWVNLEEQTELLHEASRQFLESENQPATGTRDDDIRTALDLVARDAPTDDTLLAHAEAALAEATDEVRRLGLATIPDDPMRIELMPEFRRGVAVAYCDSPGPFETGGVAYVAISPTPADWSAERSASFYREYNLAQLRNLMVHEAMPGHMLQIAHARRFRGSTRVRQMFSSGSFIEGWAVHAERMMVQAGFGGLPVRLQQLKMQLRLTINAILDAGVHAQAMTEADGLDLMMRRGFQEEGEAVGKWRRALLTSGQLSTYFVGFTELDDVLGNLSPGTSIDDVLSHGNPAPRHLATLLATGR